MTTAEFEQCMSTEDRFLRRRLVRTEDDDLTYQRTMIALWTKLDRVTWTDQSAFRNLFESYFKRWRFDRRTKATRDSKTFTSVKWTEVIGDYDNLVVNPWETHVTQAQEYIDMVPSEKIRQLLYLHYIEGYGLVEIGRLVGLSKTDVDKWIKVGVTQIKGQL